LVADAKKGISSRQLSRNLELSVKTGYSLITRIRKAFDVKNPEFN
jgi:DNA-binding CsgD family transcriptional regulator